MMWPAVAVAVTIALALAWVVVERMRTRPVQTVERLWARIVVRVA